MREVFGVQIERNDKGKVSLPFWGRFDPSARRAAYAITFFGSFGAFLSYLFI